MCKKQAQQQSGGVGLANGHLKVWQEKIFCTCLTMVWSTEDHFKMIAWSIVTPTRQVVVLLYGGSVGEISLHVCVNILEIKAVKIDIIEVWVLSVAPHCSYWLKCMALLFGSSVTEHLFCGWAVLILYFVLSPDSQAPKRNPVSLMWQFLRKMCPQSSCVAVFCCVCVLVSKKNALSPPLPPDESLKRVNMAQFVLYVFLTFVWHERFITCNVLLPLA